MIKCSNEVPTYDEPATPSVHVHSHWNRSAFVIIEIDGKKATVATEEIEAAIKNASNTGR